MRLSQSNRAKNKNVELETGWELEGLFEVSQIDETSLILQCLEFESVVMLGIVFWVKRKSGFYLCSLCKSWYGEILCCLCVFRVFLLIVSGWRKLYLGFWVEVLLLHWGAGNEAATGFHKNWSFFFLEKKRD